MRVLYYCFLCSFSLLAEASMVREAQYPAHWWQEVDRKTAPDWEILPQDAARGEVILSKRNELGRFSNFGDTPFTYRTKRYGSIEGFWQMMKYPEGKDDPRANYAGLDWKYTREEVAKMTGFAAKTAGKLAKQNMKKMGIEWITFEGKQIFYRGKDKGEHFRIIRGASWAKVRQNKELQNLLLKTGSLILRPDHHQKENAPPAYRYHDIYMEIRTQLQAMTEKES